MEKEPVGGAQERGTIQFLDIERNVFSAAGMESVPIVGEVDLLHLNSNVNKIETIILFKETDDEIDRTLGLKGKTNRFI